MNNMSVRQLENRLIQSSKKHNKNYVKANKKSFDEVLENINKDKSEIKFSKHATERLVNRNMNISQDEMKRLEKAFSKAEKKGVKDALILMDNKAFIANINNKTVITTVNKEQLEENVFTNIDGAVII